MLIWLQSAALREMKTCGNGFCSAQEGKLRPCTHIELKNAAMNPLHY